MFMEFFNDYFLYAIENNYKKSFHLRSADFFSHKHQNQ